MRPRPRTWERDFAALLAKVPCQAQVGLVVLDLSSGATVYAQEANTQLKPASVLKLFVTAAGLERLGPQFRYATRVYTKDDEVWVIGAGDPGLDDPRIAERVWSAARRSL